MKYTTNQEQQEIQYAIYRASYKSQPGRGTIRELPNKTNRVYDLLRVKTQSKPIIIREITSPAEIVYGIPPERPHPHKKLWEAISSLRERVTDLEIRRSIKRGTLDDVTHTW